MSTINTNTRIKSNLREKILITGAAGFIGSILSAELSRKGFHVIAVDANFFNTLSILAKFPNVKTIQMDFRDITIQDLSDVSQIVHLAALPNDPAGKIFDEKICEDINGTSVGELAQSAYRAGCKQFIFMSTCSVYGSSGNSDDWLTEKSPIFPLGNYAKSKRIAEEELIKVKKQGLNIAIFRAATLFGFSPIRTRLDLPVNRFSLQAHFYKKVWAIGTDLWRPLVDVHDVVRAIIAFITFLPNLENNFIINLGNSQYNWKLGEIANVVAEEFNGVPVENMNSERDLRSYRVNFDNLKIIFPQAVPSISLRSGLQIFKYILEAGQFTRLDEFSPTYNVASGYKSLLATGQLRADCRYAIMPRGKLN